MGAVTREKERESKHAPTPTHTHAPTHTHTHAPTHTRADSNTNGKRQVGRVSAAVLIDLTCTSERLSRERELGAGPTLRADMWHCQGAQDGTTPLTLFLTPPFLTLHPSFYFQAATLRVSPGRPYPKPSSLPGSLFKFEVPGDSQCFSLQHHLNTI